jgi:hypothetical protein
MRFSKALFSTLAAALVALQGAAWAAPRQDVWDFTVYLDDEPVGSHRFALTEGAAGRKVRSEAHFDVKFLLIKAYSYKHEADEAWQGDCLAELRAKTDDNGDKSNVAGVERDGHFQLQRGQEKEELPACVMSYAYWHPLMLQQKRLLNPQTGEYNDVRIDLKGQETVPVRGQPVAAKRYHLDAGKFQIDLWYADGGRWVALDSLLDNGRKLRYRIE